MRLYAVLAAVFMACYSPLLAAQDNVENIEKSQGNAVRFQKPRLLSPQQINTTKPLAVFGPFRVYRPTRAVLVDVTNSRSPADFERMLQAYPGITLLVLHESPGTENDLANLELGRMIRSRGIATYVPEGGSVRSGGVELFLAGARRFADKGAEFAVHAWMDDRGREANHYHASAPENRKYVEYYRQMGMSESKAKAFYAMTNSVPHAQAYWFDEAEMAQWVRLDRFEG